MGKNDGRGRGKRVFSKKNIGEGGTPKFFFFPPFSAKKTSPLPIARYLRCKPPCPFFDLLDQILGFVAEKEKRKKKKKKKEKKSPWQVTNLLCTCAELNFWKTLLGGGRQERKDMGLILLKIWEKLNTVILTFA